MRCGWVPVLMGPLRSCVTSGRLLNFSEPVSPFVKKNNLPVHKEVRRILLGSPYDYDLFHKEHEWKLRQKKAKQSLGHPQEILDYITRLGIHTKLILETVCSEWSREAEQGAWLQAGWRAA